MLKIRYTGTRPFMMPDGTYIFNDEKRVISEEHADVLEPNKDLFEVLGFQEDPQVVDLVEEVEPVGAPEALEEVEPAEASEALEDAEPVEASEPVEDVEPAEASEALEEIEPAEEKPAVKRTRRSRK